MPEIEFASLIMGPAGVAAAGAIVLSVLAGSYGIRSARLGNSPGPAALAAARGRTLTVEPMDPDLVESVAISQRIADLMIADEWSEISRLIAEWEDQLASTPGGVRYHDVAAETCLSGLQGLIDDSPRTSFPDLHPALAELAQFEDTLTGAPGDHILALLAARAHLAVGDAFRGGSWPEADRREAYRRMARHYLAAGGILAEFDPLAYMSPLLAETHYRQAAGAPGGAHRLPDLFETWIDLDPANMRAYTAHAIHHLAVPGDVSDREIRVEAERALERTGQTLGAGGYALFFLPLLSRRPGARQLVEEDVFIAALFDLATRDASQCDVNWVAGILADEIVAAPRAQASALRDVFHMLVSQDLTVLYPRLWNRTAEEVLLLIAEAAGSATRLSDTAESDLFDRAA